MNDFQHISDDKLRTILCGTEDEFWATEPDLSAYAEAADDAVYDDEANADVPLSVLSQREYYASKLWEAIEDHHEDEFFTLLKAFWA